MVTKNVNVRKNHYKCFDCYCVTEHIVPVQNCHCVDTLELLDSGVQTSLL